MRTVAPPRDVSVPFVVSKSGDTSTDLDTETLKPATTVTKTIGADKDYQTLGTGDAVKHR